MNNADFEIWSFLAGVCLAIIIMVLIYVKLDFYKQGQIDALTGKVKYELITHEDTTKTWEMKEEE